MQCNDQVWQNVDAKRELFEQLSDRVFDTPELLYHETQSSAAHEAMLREQGFRVTVGAADIPTAVIGEAGTGGPVIAILGEFDALAGLSQVPGIAEQQPVEQDGNGHGCGHNLLGAGALLAATAMKDYLEEQGIEGRVRYYGCPAEEGGAGKTFMVRAGCFDDVDAAITWHPKSYNRVAPAIALANTRIDFTFTGRAAHAASQPEFGRSALDAVELMSVGVNYMREHMPSNARVHGAILNTGGTAPNVVQALAKVRYAVRDETRVPMLELVDRVKRIADGAALMTETSVRSEVLSSFSELVGNRPLEEAAQRQLEAVGPAAYDDADRSFAAEIQKTLGPDAIANIYKAIGDTPVPNEVLHERITPLDAEGIPLMGSTDVGDVSWVVPTVQIQTATAAFGTPMHSWQLVAQGKSSAAKKGMVQAAKVMAGTGMDLIADAQLMLETKQDFAERTQGTPYQSPIPADVSPPLHMGAKG